MKLKYNTDIFLFIDLQRVLHKTVYILVFKIVLHLCFAVHVLHTCGEQEVTCQSEFSTPTRRAQESV